MLKNYLIQNTQGVRDRYYDFRRMLDRSEINKRKSVLNELSWSDISLRDKGFAISTGWRDNPLMQEVLEDADRRMKVVDSGKSKKNSKAQLQTGLLDPSQLDKDSPFVKLALDERIVERVAKYLGEIPILTKIDLWKSVPTSEHSSSQLHHCDWAAQRQMKIFVYITDVDSSTGPLSILTAQSSERLRDAVDYKYGTYLQDEEVHAHVDKSQETEILGQKGTVAFADTSYCFHFGSRVKGASKSRTVLMMQYLPIGAFKLSRDFAKSCPLLHIAEDHMPIWQQLVLGRKYKNVR